MKILKSILAICAVASIAYSCEVTGGPELRGSWCIDNQSDELFTSILVGLGPRSFTETVKIYPQSKQDLTETSFLNKLDNPATEFEDGSIQLSFVFRNGIIHTFEGEITEHDIRIGDNWNLVVSDDELVRTYTYTFTNEDYQRIMSLYE